MKKISTMFFVLLFAASLFAQPCDPATDPNCTLLSVEMLYFNGQSVKGGVQLNWATSSEVNSSHFLLEKSSDAKVWTKLAEIKTFNKPTTYSYDDLSNVSAYYRLSEVGQDGTVEVFKAIFVERFSKRLEVFPNPTATSVTIVSELPTTVYNVTGKLYHVVEKGSAVLDLPKGFFVAKSGEEIKRIVVQ